MSKGKGRVMKPDSNIGRKGRYEEWLTEENLLRVQGWAMDGLSDKQIAGNMGISLTTYYDWKNNFPKFADAVKNGKDIVDRMVENALFKSALGYTYQEEVLTKDGIVQLEKVQHANQTAQIFWLKNRKPQQWRDKQDININNTVLDMTEEERQARINELKGKLENNVISLDE